MNEVFFLNRITEHQKNKKNRILEPDELKDYNLESVKILQKLKEEPRG